MASEQFTEFLQIEQIPSGDWVATSACRHLVMHTIADTAWEVIMDGLCDHDFDSEPVEEGNVDR